MSENPTYEELEKRVQELESLIIRSGEPFLSFKDSDAHEASKDSAATDFFEFELSDIINVKAIQSLMENFFKLTKIGVAILDLSGEILVSTGWQDVCTKFHRVHPESRKNCLESDLQLSSGVKPGEFKLYRCKNNMWDMSTPIMVGDRKVGNLYLGQFLFENESPDVEIFRHQARIYNFDEEKYIEALDRVPRWSRLTVETVMHFYTQLASLISQLGYNNLMLSQAIVEKDKFLSQLKESETKHRKLVENINDVIYAVDTVGNIIYISPPIESVLGYKPSELIGRNFIELIHIDNQSMLSTLFKDVLQKQLRPSEYRVRAKNNKFRWVRTSSRPIFKKGQVLGIQGVLTDITEGKQSELELIKSENRYRDLVQSVNSAIIRYQSDGTITYFNEYAQTFFGYSIEEVIGKNIGILLPGQESSGIDLTGLVQDIVDHPHHYINNINENICSDGRRVWMSWTNKAFKDSNGLVTEILTVGNDITEKKRAEDALQKGRAQLEAALESMSDAVFISDAKGRFVEFNLAFATFHKFANRTECYESLPEWQNILDVYQTDSTLMPLDMWAVPRALRGETATNCEYRLQRKDTGETWFGSYNFSPILNGEGQIVGSVVVARDITEERKLQTHLQKAQRMESIGNLAGGIAHDFNNILFPIVGMSELLLEDLPPGSGERENVEEIFKAGKRGSDLVKQILAFSRQTEHKMMPTRIQNVLKEVIKLSRSTIPTYIEIKQDIQQDCGMVMADPSQIHQIGMNIITNAYHAVEETGGIISVQLKQMFLWDTEMIEINISPGDYAVLSISDSGHGISEEHIGKIFDPYFTTKPQEKGTGLGLAVVYGIVKAHGGDIRVFSEIGKGSTFDIYLPLMKKTNGTDSVPEDEACRGGNERILLVDDEESIAKLEKQILERMGYTVSSHFHSVEALAAFKASPSSFDLVITDMNMPHMPGDKLANKIKSIRSDIAIILCTGFSERIHEDNFKQMGIDGLLMKPVVKSKLAKTVRKVLDDVKGEI